LLKETTGAFDGAQIHNLHITSQTRNSLRSAAPHNQYQTLLVIRQRMMK